MEPEVLIKGKFSSETKTLVVNNAGPDIFLFISLPSALTRLECKDCGITKLPIFLPPTLTHLICPRNKLRSLPILPKILEQLDCSGNELDFLPLFEDFKELKTLICNNNSLTTLTSLPPNLTFLDCDGNKNMILSTLPSTLEYLHAGSCDLTSLPSLSETGLKSLSVSNNRLLEIPILPCTLVYLRCGWNLLTSLPSLPPKLDTLECQYNHITNLGKFPSELAILRCGCNRLERIKRFPSTLREIGVENNPLECLPPISYLLHMKLDWTWSMININGTKVAEKYKLHGVRRYSVCVEAQIRWYVKEWRLAQHILSNVFAKKTLSNRLRI